MNESFEKFCKKYSLTDQAKIDFKNLVEKEIVNVFYKKSFDDSKSDLNPINKGDKVTKKSIVKSKVSSEDTCKGKKANGENCTFKAKNNGYCGRHDPDKPSKAPGSNSSKPRVKKESKRDCHAVIVKTGKQCIQPGTEKPDKADFFYCKRHAADWVEYENDHTEKLCSDKECSDKEDVLESNIESDVESGIDE